MGQVLQTVGSLCSSTTPPSNWVLTVAQPDTHNYGHTAHGDGAAIRPSFLTNPLHKLHQISGECNYELLHTLVDLTLCRDGGQQAGEL